MEKAIFVSFLLFLFAVQCYAMYSCGTCEGRFVLQPDGQQCTSVPKSKCPGLNGHSTHSWRRGTHVMSNCNSIPSQTAIATFQGSGGRYNGGSFQHAAIFMGCTSNGIRVHDQWAGRSGGCSERIIRSTGKGSNGANNFYTIEL